MSQWGGIPLIEKSFTPSDDLLVARNTFEETVDFIVKDLDEAASILPLNGDKARATKGAAMALKARVLLYAASDLFVSQSLWASGYEHPELIGYVGGDRTERWQRAKKAAKAVMDLGIYHLYGEMEDGKIERKLLKTMLIFSYVIIRMKILWYNIMIM